MHDLICTPQLIVKPSRREMRCEVSTACLVWHSRLFDTVQDEQHRIHRVMPVLKISCRLPVGSRANTTRLFLQPAATFPTHP